MVSVNWLLSEDKFDEEEELLWGFLDHLMVGTAASPLRKALNDSGLGEAVIGGGLEDTLRQPVFSMGLKGVVEEDLPKVEELVMKTLKEIESEGFTSEQVESNPMLAFSRLLSHTAPCRCKAPWKKRVVVVVVVVVIVIAVHSPNSFLVSKIYGVLKSDHPTFPIGCTDRSQYEHHRIQLARKQHGLFPQRPEPDAQVHGCLDLRQGPD